MNSADLAALMADYGELPLRIVGPRGEKLVVGIIEDVAEPGLPDGEPVPVARITLVPAAPLAAPPATDLPPEWAPGYPGV
jgi:hypothetical protein